MHCMQDIPYTSRDLLVLSDVYSHWNDFVCTYYIGYRITLSRKLTKLFDEDTI